VYKKQSVGKKIKSPPIMSVNMSQLFDPNMRVEKKESNKPKPLRVVELNPEDIKVCCMIGNQRCNNSTIPPCKNLERCIISRRHAMMPFNQHSENIVGSAYRTYDEHVMYICKKVDYGDRFKDRVCIWCARFDATSVWFNVETTLTFGWYKQPFIELGLDALIEHDAKTQEQHKGASPIFPLVIKLKLDKMTCPGPIRSVSLSHLGFRRCEDDMYAIFDGRCALFQNGGDATRS